ncbi:MAG: DUF58 domain-containing protein [Pirellulaceae bacterium]
MHELFTKYLDLATLTELSGLRLRSNRRFGGSASGEHHSFRMGQAIEFSQHRQYAPGDDLRYIDWKIYGRSDKFYLKQSEDETDLSCYVLLDCSESMSYAGNDSTPSKFTFAVQLAFGLAFISLQQQDPVSLSLITDHLVQYLPPSNASGSMARWEQGISGCELRDKTNLPIALAQFADAATQPSLVVLISDLLGPESELRDALPLLRRGNDAIVLHVMDRRERSFAFDGELRIEGLENLGIADVNATQIQKGYLKEVETFIQTQKQACWNLNFGFASVTTDQPLASELSSLFRR